MMQQDPFAQNSLKTPKVGAIQLAEACVSIKDLNKVLDEATFLQGLGFEAKVCAPGYCVLHVPYLPRNDRPGGVVNGMTIMGAADVAMWLAILSARGVHEQWVTADMKTSFLRPARQEAMACTAKVLKLGKHSAYGTVEIHGADGTLLTHHVLSFAKVVPRS
jgi:uncharacterized protein (TIGR00369 family)